MLSARHVSPPERSAFDGVVMPNDVFEIMVSDDMGNVTFEPASVWNVLDTGFEVTFLHRCPEDQLMWQYGEVQFVEWQSVNLHLSLSRYTGNTVEEKQKRAFQRLGYRMLGDNKFYKISEEETVARALPHREACVGLMDTSDEDTELDTDEECDDVESLDENGNLKDLIVDDEDCELWTAADGEFAEETHRAAAEFDAHVPVNDRQLRVKDALDRLEVRVRREEQERAWSQGM